MHTLKVMAGGLALLAVCLLVGRWIGGAANGVKLFFPLWLIAAGINLWVGVSRAGYSVVEEAPVFLVVFSGPAAVALLALWALSRG